MFEQRFDVSGKEQNTLAAILALVLGHKLQVEQLHSPFVCSTCKVSLLNYEDLARQLIKLRLEILETHKQTIKLYEAKVKEHEEEEYLKEDEEEAEEDKDLDNEQCFSEEDLIEEVCLSPEEEPTDFIEQYSDNLDIIESCSDASDLIERCSVDTNFLNDEDDHEKSSDGTQQNLPRGCSKKTQGQGRRRAARTEFTCSFCGKVCARRAALVEHERIHTGERPIKCDLCDARFAQRANWRSHIKATHLKESNFKCQYCEREFKRRRLLDNHIKSVHTKQRDLQCDQCRSTFSNAVNLKKHQLCHTNDKNYSCQICGKQFSRAENRDIHLFVHSIRKPYACHVCGEGFMRKQKLVHHSQVSKHDNQRIVRLKPLFSAANSDKLLQQANESQKL
ncbi:hypothetical protein ACLKA7_006796 [Drosophila subpalustris]